MTATRDAREIADRAISYADKLWHLSIADVLVLAKEHLALLERCAELEHYNNKLTNFTERIRVKAS